LKAQKLVEAQSFKEAISLLRGTVRRHPADAGARLMLGTALALLPRRSEALEELGAAIRLRPDFAPGHHALGLALARFVEPERARQAFEKAVDLDPRFAQAHVDLALVLAQIGEVNRAVTHLEKAIEIEADSPRAAYAHHLRGLLYAERDQPELAARAFERAVALRPDHAEAFLHLGLARRRLLDFKGTVAALRQAARLYPESAQMHYELGRELLRAGQAGEAIVHLRTAVRSRPEDTAALYSLARALRIAGQTIEAEDVAARMRKLRSRTEQADKNAFEGSRFNNEGIALERAGNLPLAIQRYASALELDPLNTVFRRNLALALCRTGRWSEGTEELKEVLRLDPGDQEAAKALYIAMERAERKP
jgi:tetratricopeptide (TPR) repeat protein